MFKSKKQIDQEKTAINKVEESKREAFFSEYKELAKKHGYDFSVKLQITEQGIVPRIIIIEVKKEEKNVEPSL